MSEAIYPGIFNDHDGGLTPLGRTVMDAWVFGLIPETQTCNGWTAGQMQALIERVSAAWAPYGHLPGKLPEPLRDRHSRIYEAALRRARAAGWQPADMEDE